MEKSLKYCLSICFILFSIKGFTQINCEAIQDENCKKACKIYNMAEPMQGSNYSQVAFDYAIELCPNFADAYREKSVPYLKRGDFITWKILIDKAVEINPKEHLGYRGWCRFQFLRDYKGAIEDFEKLENLGEDLRFSQNGDYHLTIVKGMCYAKLGQSKKAIQIIENQLNKKDPILGFYDYYQLGIIYFEQKNYQKALECFNKTNPNYEFAENIFYKSKVYKILNDKDNYLKNKNLATKYYTEGKTMRDAYTHHLNKIYLKEIEEL